jgi:hypothetical protein
MKFSYDLKVVCDARLWNFQIYELIPIHGSLVDPALADSAK